MTCRSYHGCRVQTVSFTISTDDVAFYGIDTAFKTVQPGTFTIRIGSSPDASTTLPVTTKTQFSVLHPDGGEWDGFVPGPGCAGPGDPGCDESGR